LVNDSLWIAARREQQMRQRRVSLRRQRSSLETRVATARDSNIPIPEHGQGCNPLATIHLTEPTIIVH
jgi:hypothetical protein